MGTWKKQRTQQEQELYDKRLGLNQEEPKETEGEAWLKGQNSEAVDRATVRFLGFIIFCVFVFIASLAANDAPSPLDTYPFRDDATPYFILGD